MIKGADFIASLLSIVHALEERFNTRILGPPEVVRKAHWYGRHFAGECGVGCDRAQVTAL